MKTSLPKTSPIFETILVSRQENKFRTIEKILEKYCPQTKVRKVTDFDSNQHLIVKPLPNLVIFDVNKLDSELFNLLIKLSFHESEVIIVSNSRDLALEAFKFSVSGFVLKPIEPEDLVLAVKNACTKIDFRNEYRSNRKVIDKIEKKLSGNDIIGIPTMEGFDFIKINQVIRCEGLQRCTQIILLNNKKIISSYNLGEFRYLLEPHGFFSPHRSHLINLNYIVKYYKDGSISMQDGSSVPVARRRKVEFLNLITHV